MLRNFRGTRGGIFMRMRKDVIVQEIKKRKDDELTHYSALPHNGCETNVNRNRNAKETKRLNSRKITNSINIASARRQHNFERREQKQQKNRSK